MFALTHSLAKRAAALPDSAIDSRRYARHLMLPEIGLAGQKRLAVAKVLVVGAGGLGCPVLSYLSAAGVGTLGIVDADVVEASNLQRQILYTALDIGKAKAEVAAARLRSQAPESIVVVHAERLHAGNAHALLQQYDVVIDATDNFPSRYLINDTCVALGIPTVYGSVFRFEGQASLFYPPHGPCYRCLFPQAPGPGDSLSCADAGVLGVLPGQIGLLQATETLKLLLGLRPSLLGQLLIYDALQLRFSTIVLERNPACPVCGSGPRPEGKHFDSRQPLRMVPQITASALDALQVAGGVPSLIDVRTPTEVKSGAITGHLNMPLATFSQGMQELPRSVKIVVYCQSGVRSQVAAKILLEAGFNDVSILQGGITAWIERGLPLFYSGELLVE